MVNFAFNSDPSSHVCEVQLVHRELMVARAGLGGHAVYGKGRAATELLQLATAVGPTKTNASSYF